MKSSVMSRSGGPKLSYRSQLVGSGQKSPVHRSAVDGEKFPWANSGPSEMSTEIPLVPGSTTMPYR